MGDIPQSAYALELLTKRYLGSVNAHPNTPYNSDTPNFGRPNIIPGLQIFAQPIPSVAPSDMVVDGTWSNGTRSVSTTYPHIAKYTGATLNVIVPGKSFWLGTIASYNKVDNILSSQIPFNYDPIGSYAFQVYLNNSPIQSSGTPPFVMDQDAGILVFLPSTNAPSVTSITGTIKCDFWRYEGTFGFASSAVETAFDGGGPVSSTTEAPMIIDAGGVT